MVSRKRSPADCGGRRCWADEGLVGNNCVVQISDNGSADQATWYDLWGELQAIIAVCLKAGMIGTSVAASECCVSDLGISCVALLTCSQGTHRNLEVNLHLHLD